MADFTTTLASPQGAGAQPLAPVQEHIVPATPNPLLGEVVNIFAEGLKAQRKQDALDLKTAVVGEYIRNENTYKDAFTSGQWTAAQAATASRANYSKFIASHSQYIDDLSKARKEVYEGTDIGEAQRQVQDDIKQRNEDKAAASRAGFEIPVGASQQTVDYAIAAHKSQVRLTQTTDAAYKANAERRAEESHGQATQKHIWAMQDHQAKNEAINGINATADSYFNYLGSFSKDLQANTSMTFEQKQMAWDAQVNTFKQKALAVSMGNPELAAPWMKLADDMTNTFKAITDPKVKSETELQMLKNQFDAQMYKQKLIVTADPKVRSAVAVSSLFGNNSSLIDLAVTPVVVGSLAQLGLGPDSGAAKPQVIGTPDEKAVLKTLKGAMSLIQKGSANGDQGQNQKEAVNSVNEVLRQTGLLERGRATPDQFKELTAFYSSNEFGKMATTGTLDADTMRNAKTVWQASYVPAVKQAVESRLLQTIDRAPARGGAPFRKTDQKTVMDTLNVQFDGANVRFIPRPDAQQTISSDYTVSAIKEAEAGLNAIVRTGAHLEGSTNYAKHWEENKHLYLPAIFPDPAKLKPGQVVDGYKYLGGAYGSKSNWQRVEGQ